MSVSGDQRPWLAFYGDVPTVLEYPHVTLYEALARSAAVRPDATALDFLGATLIYGRLVEDVDRCAAALADFGLARGERITISMPTSPQGMVAFFAAAKLGAVASMIHPLSTASEIEGYLSMSRSRVALTLDAFYDRFAEARQRTPLETLVLTSIGDALTPAKRFGFWLTRGRKIPRVPEDAEAVRWPHLMGGRSQAATPAAAVDTHDLAAILYSAERRALRRGSCSRTTTSSARPCSSPRGFGSTSAIPSSRSSRSSTDSASPPSSSHRCCTGRRS